MADQAYAHVTWVIDQEVTVPDPIILQQNDAEGKAEALFQKSLPEQYAQFKQQGYISIPSRLFPDYKYVVCQSIMLYKKNACVKCDVMFLSGDLGKVCVTLDKSVDYIPLWDCRLQFCLMLLYQEEAILKIGNWIDNKWAMSGGYTAYEYLKANGNLYETNELRRRPWYSRWF